MKKINRLQVLACSVAILAFASCTDAWDEHYQYQSNPLMNAEENLWELISNDPELKEFTAFLVATKYDSLLMKDRNFTVWAPVDGTGLDTMLIVNAKLLNEETRDSLFEVYCKEIVENHIADYSHVAGGFRDKEDVKNYKKVSVLNGKSYHFEGSVKDGYTFSGSRLKTPNLVAKNGVLHKLGGSVEFAANIWEKLPKIGGVDSLWKFLEKDYKVTFNPSLSVPGNIVNGQQEFEDSAWDISCRWFQEIGYLNREDSSYTMYALSNDAWEEMFEMTKSYYMYNSSLVDQSSKKLYYEIRDSVAKELMCRNLVFSNKENERFFDGETDTLRSTRGQIFKGEEAYALSRGGWESYTLSNGTLHIVDKLMVDEAKVFNPLTCWHDTIRIQAEQLSGDERYPDNSADNDKDGKGFGLVRKSFVAIPDTIAAHDSVAGGAICSYTAEEGFINPYFNFYIDNVLSAKYRIKLVLLPPQAINPWDDWFVKPNKFTARIYFDNGKGETASYLLRTKDGESTFYSNPEKIDTIVFFYESGTGLTDGVHIPVCEANLNRINEAAKVQTRLHLESTIEFGERRGENKGTEKNPQKWQYDNDYRIDEVIFEPLPADYVYEKGEE